MDGIVCIFSFPVKECNLLVDGKTASLFGCTDTSGWSISFVVQDIATPSKSLPLVFSDVTIGEAIAAFGSQSPRSVIPDLLVATASLIEGAVAGACTSDGCGFDWSAFWDLMGIVHNVWTHGSRSQSL
ncbi:hypothetical protein DPMN_159393 [Dreissena polymorpha]|uniref:Uncharacterized protein n=1 Tax=Dreissena polymorpha TaxID=45954 RepID=A0A9D4EPB3_DREPO|nr:hypothetical protein DPMN_159393 [Dreissena polymorpha]